MSRTQTIVVALIGVPLLLACGFIAALLAIGLSLAATGPSDGIPRESFIPSDHDLGDWDESADPLGSALTQGDEMHLIIEETVWGDPLLSDPDSTVSWQTSAATYRDDYADLSASIDVRAVSADPSASGCLMVRADPEIDPVLSGDPDAASEGDRYAFNLCLSEEYGVYAWWWDETRPDGYTVDFVWFDDPRVWEAMRPLEEWNRLKIIAEGETIWMFLNGDYVGATRYTGPAEGTVGFRIDVERETHATFAFRNLEIRGLGWI
jgi:hypothetical protein